MNVKDGALQTSVCNSLEAALSCNNALKQGSGRKIVDELAAQGPFIRRPSARGVAEEALGADMNVRAFVPLLNALASLDVSRP